MNNNKKSSAISFRNENWANKQIIYVSEVCSQ